MPIRKIISVSLAVVAGLSFAACGPKATNAKSNVEAVASASANVQAKTTLEADVTKCAQLVPPFELLSKTKRAPVVACLDKITTQKQRQDIETCIFTAAIRDHVITPSGKKKFEDVDLGTCINEGLAPAAKTPVATPTK